MHHQFLAVQPRRGLTTVHRSTPHGKLELPAESVWNAWRKAVRGLDGGGDGGRADGVVVNLGGVGRGHVNLLLPAVPQLSGVAEGDNEQRAEHGDGDEAGEGSHGTLAQAAVVVGGGLAGLVPPCGAKRGSVSKLATKVYTDMGWMRVRDRNGASATHCWSPAC